MIMGKNILILFVCFVLSFRLNAQVINEKPYIRESDNEIALRSGSSQLTGTYDVKYHRFELEVDPAVKYIKGSVTTYFNTLVSQNNMVFDFRNNMTVDSVMYHGSSLAHSFISYLQLRVIYPNSLPVGVIDSLTIYYHGVPYEDGFGSFKVKNTTCSTQDSVMWTLSEPYGGKNWWPCKEVLTDKIDSVDMLVTANIKYHIGSNGLLVKRDTVGNKITDHWKHRYPIPAYLIAFAVSEYSIYKDTFDLYNGGQLEILNYVFPCDSAYAHTQTQKLDTAMNFFIKKFGAYPYENEKYGHAQCRFGGGMEHTTMTFMGGWWYYILIHELAHQWFGDKITCGSWHHIWLNEGFATYLEGLTCEEGIQTTSFHSWLSSKKSSVLSDGTGSVYCDDTTSVNRIFSSRLTYNKGAYLLHMLRWVLGDDDFFNGVNSYINDPNLVYGFAKTPDLVNHLEIAGDTTLTEFFNDWFYGEGWPDYNINWSIDTDCNKLRVKILQSHSANQGTFFEMPVPIKFEGAGFDTTIVFKQFSPDDTLFFKEIDFEATSAEFDPDLWLCAGSTIIKESLPVKTIHWTGDFNNFWNDSANWDCGLPTIDDEVVIPNNTPDCIVQKEQTGYCKKLRIKDGGKVRTLEGASLIIGD